MSETTEKRAPKILVQVVTYNNQATIKRCLESLVKQQGVTLWDNLVVRVSDNCSTDNTLEILEDNFSSDIRLHKNSQNLGFCAANNEAVRQAEKYNFDYLLLVNPDLRLESDAIVNLLQALEDDSSAAIACPMLLRADEALNPVIPQRYDATGMFITPALRHFDRGSGKKRSAKLEQPAYVFGASGACFLLRVAAAKDLSLDPAKIELFDESFFAYREDADLAWRAAWLGWKVRYQPEAIGYHQRRVLPQGRSALPEKLNMLGVQNRFLLQLNNFSHELGPICSISATVRNLIVLAGVYLRERSSIAGLKNIEAMKPRALARRKLLAQRARVLPEEVKRWFSFIPHSEPVLLKEKRPEHFRSLTIIVVNYNSGNRLSNLLRELTQAQTTLNSELTTSVVIVDNNSHDSSAARIKPLFDTFEGVSFIMNSDNRGFAGAINQVANSHPADCYLILNPDVTIRPKAIKQLLTTLESYANLGAISPVLLNELGKSQHGFIARSFPTLSATLAEFFFIHRLWPENRWQRSYLLQNRRLLTNYLNLQQPKNGEAGYRLEEPVIVDQPAGACLMIRGTAFESLRGFDEKFWPAWFEDVDFCKRLNNTGYLCAISAAATVKHEGGHSVQSISAGEFVKAWYGNLTRYWKKHGNLAQYLVIRACVPLALFARYLYVSIKKPTSGIYSQVANTDDLQEALIKTAANPGSKKPKN